MSGSGSEAEKEIIKKAESLFDVVGVPPYSEGSLLILGLLTTPQRDLDDFAREEVGDFRLRGFQTHALPRMEELVRFIRERGVAAEIWGKFGYPQGNDLNLKQQAVVAGLGSWGKNSLVLHPRFGPWLRFMAVKVQASLTPTDCGADNHKENPLCQGCSACIDACPVNILEPYYLRDISSCLASVSSMPQVGKLVACDRCLAACPVGR